MENRKSSLYTLGCKLNFSDFPCLQDEGFDRDFEVADMCD
jgi:hypothetical protein